MSDVLSGLESMGLGNLSNIELFNDKKAKDEAEKKKAEKAAEVKELEEKDLIFIKNVECACCGINADVLKYQLKKVEKTEVTDTASISEEPIVYEIIHGKGAPLTCASVSDYHVVDGLFRRELIIENKIRLHEDLFLHEDDVFMAEVFAKAKCVVATQLPLYRYVSDSQYSHTHKPTLERARRIVDSALLAVQYRFDATSSLNNPKVVFHERLKAMRFVYLCSRHMISAGYSLSEYRETLNRFRPYGCYPLDYRWLRESLAVTPKLLFKTFLCNHPKIAYLIYK